LDWNRRSAAQNLIYQQFCRAERGRDTETFVAGRHGVVGAQPYAALEQLVNKARAEGDAD